MILKRIVENAKQQHWTSVFIELAILVLGVFIGLQVDNWNDVRKDRAAESRVLHRMQSEIVALNAVRKERYQYQQHNMANLTAAESTIFGLDDRLALDENECRSVSGSHIYVGAPDELPVLDELSSTGHIDLIHDAGLRQDISAFVTARNVARNRLYAINLQINRLGILYPDLIEHGMSRAVDGSLEPSYSCDLSAMRASRAFKNTLLDNVARFEATTDSYIMVGEKLDQLAKEIAVSLVGSDGQEDY